MRDLTLHPFPHYRLVGPEAERFLQSRNEGPAFGIFLLPPLRLIGRGRPRPGAGLFMVIATTDGGWDHVSISLRDRCATWEEMDGLKRLFFRDDETSMQLHVPPRAHINCHPYCLHLWRPQGKRFSIWAEGDVPAPSLDWVIVGGESGPGARPMHPGWARQIRDDCAAAGVPFFFKQWGEWAPDQGPIGHDCWPLASWDGQSWIRDKFIDADDDPVFRVGKKAAGRTLDGVTYDAMPVSG
jgi:hypothetical protein